MNPIRPVSFSLVALVATALASASAASSFEDINMNSGISVDGQGNILVQWQSGGFDEYHVGWKVNGGPRGSRTRPGDKRFTVLMRYSPGSVYEVGVQGCTKHTLGHDQCTSWDTVSCGGPGSPCAGSPEARRLQGNKHTY